MIDLKTTVIAATASLALGVFSAWYLTADYKEAKYKAVLSEMRENAAMALFEAQKSAVEKERENNRLAQELEVQNAKHRQELAKVEDELRGYVNELGGLYDRYATCSSASVPTDTATAPSLLLQPPAPDFQKNLRDYFFPNQNVPTKQPPTPRPATTGSRG